MKSVNVPGYDIKALEYQHAIKKAEYYTAIRNGEIFDNLKIRFLELKQLQKTLHQLKAEKNFPIVEVSREAMGNWQ